MISLCAPLLRYCQGIALLPRYIVSIVLPGAIDITSSLPAVSGRRGVTGSCCLGTALNPRLAAYCDAPWL